MSADGLGNSVATFCTRYARPVSTLIEAGENLRVPSGREAAFWPRGIESRRRGAGRAHYAPGVFTYLPFLRSTRVGAYPARTQSAGA